MLLPLRRRRAVWLLVMFAALTPIEGRADIIDLSDVEITAFGSFSTQRQPTMTASDIKVAPLGDPTRAEVLLLAEGGLAIPFPNKPTSQTQAFASSAADATGFFGVGVSGFFFRNSLPPNDLVASGSTTQSVTNNTTATLPLFVDFFIPAPTVQFQNVGNSFPSGADPDLDAFAIARITLSTILTRPNGTTVERDLLDYGVRSFREPASGVFTALPIGAGQLTRFVDFDSFGFHMPDLAGEDFSLGEIGPGDTLEFTYDYFVQGKTGFGETGVFAAIGDPFNLGVSGGRFDLQLGAEPPPPGVPEPGTLVLLGLGLVVMSRKRSRT